MDWLAQIAPTIATALGGPLAGMAVSAVSKAIGCTPEEVQNVISNNKLDATQVAALQQAELELKKQAQAMNLDFAKLANDDRKSARDMQATTRSIIPPVLALVVTVGFFGILIGGSLSVTGLRVTIHGVHERESGHRAVTCCEADVRLCGDSPDRGDARIKV